MTNIASTVYTKSDDKTVGLNNTPPHTTLIEALWVLFNSTASTTEPSEPSTPEALAVVMHMIRIPRETSTLNCYHTGTLGAYIRLNDLKVNEVLSDNYCGFHTAIALLHIDTRKALVHKTPEYMLRYTEETSVYLKLHNITDYDGIVNLLMTSNRWLTVDELSFIFKAHGKCPVAITPNTYPIYDPQCVYYIIQNCHYEPVTHVQHGVVSVSHCLYACDQLCLYSVIVTSCFLGSL